jgi:hypothetical protein
MLISKATGRSSTEATTWLWATLTTWATFLLTAFHDASSSIITSSALALCQVSFRHACPTFNDSIRQLAQ